MNKYIVMYTYKDNDGQFGGKVEVFGETKDEAENKFYQLNHCASDNVRRKKNVFAEDGRYICENIFSYSEWLKAGKPLAPLRNQVLTV